MKLLRSLGTVCVCIAAFLPQSANAALINADWLASNDNLITRDTVSNLDWLDITETAGMSRDDVLAEMVSGGIFAGFRYATSFEVVDLWAQYGITLMPETSVVDYDVLDPNIITASLQLGNLYAQETSISDYGTLGFIAVDIDSVLATSGWVGAFRQSGNSYYEGPTINPLDSHKSKTWLGSYIVTAVPVPAAFWLFGSGLLALIGFAKKRSS